jgi:hypothetical protein
MNPEQFHELVSEAVDGYTPAAPVISQLRRRALRRRRTIIGVSTLSVVAAIGGGTAAVAAAVSGSGSPTAIQVGGGQSGSATPSPSSAVTPSAVTTTVTATPAPYPTNGTEQDYTQRCTGWISHFHYIRATRVSTSGGRTTLTGHKGYIRCGGPSDIGFFARQKVIRLAIRPDATVTRPRLNHIRGPSTTRIAVTQLPRYMTIAVKGINPDYPTFFGYRGPRSAVTVLTGLYHP